MVTGIIGRKVGMTQIFDADGTVHPATVIKAGPCVIVQAKNAQRDGYEAVQIGLVEETPAKVGKPDLHRFVAVALRVLRLDHDAGPGLDDGGRMDGAIRVENLRHPNFSADDAS